MKKLILIFIAMITLALPAMAAEDPLGFRLFLIAKQNEGQGLESLYRLRLPNVTAFGLNRSDHYVGANYALTDWLKIEGTGGYVITNKNAPGVPKYSTPMLRGDVKFYLGDWVIINAAEYFTRWEAVGIYNDINWQLVTGYHVGAEIYNLVFDWVSKREQNSYNFGPYISRDFGKFNVHLYYRFHARPNTKTQNARSILITLCIPFMAN